MKRFYWIKLRAGPSRDYFQSAAASIWFDTIVRFRNDKSTVGSLKILLLQAAYMTLHLSTYHQYVPVISHMLFKIKNKVDIINVVEKFAS